MKTATHLRVADRNGRFWLGLLAEPVRSADRPVRRASGTHYAKDRPHRDGEAGLSIGRSCPYRGRTCLRSFLTSRDVVGAAVVRVPLSSRSRASHRVSSVRTLAA